MSDDPRTDFFASGADDDAPAAAAPVGDVRTAFFAADAPVDTPKAKAPAATPEPVYDAAEFKRRVGRDPEPAELQNFKASKGEGWANGSTNGSFKGLGEAALATGSAAFKGVAHAANDIIPDFGDKTRSSVEADLNSNPVLNYRGGPEAQPYLDALGDVTAPIARAGQKIHQGIANVAGNRTADVAGDAFTLLPGLRGAGKGLGKLVDSMHDPEAVPTAAAPTAESTLAQQAASSQGNMGAALAVPDLAGVSPELKQSIVDAGANGAPIHQEALRRHIDADTLPMPEGTSPLQLRKGQATFDGQQISDEKNLRADPDTQSVLANSITDQDGKLGASMGEIRRRATPDIVQNSTRQHSQNAIDSIKTQDNAAVTDIRAKYKALADQHGGTMPIDASQVTQQIDDGLSNGFLNKTATEDPSISEVLDSIRSGRPMSFEQFENARTNLATVQRKGGSPAAAATIVRNALENVPLAPEARGLKDLADTARSAAKSRFDTIEQNPSYKAAVEDNVPKVNGLHQIGADSPLADSFMDNYFLGNGRNASRAYISRMKGVMQGNEDFSPAIEAASLNKLRDAAGLDGFDNGTFKNAGYRSARNAMDHKADVLMSPQSVEHTDQLKRVSGYVNDEPKDASTNRSNTALTLQRFGAVFPSAPTVAGDLANVGADVAAGHLGPVGVVTKRIGQTFLQRSRDAKTAQALKDAKLKFARDATAPGAGLSKPAKAGGGAVGFATGGHVADHDALLAKLVGRWKAAKKHTDKATEPLLKMPDASIVKALEIAQEHI